MINQPKLGRFDKFARNVLLDTSKMLKDAKKELFGDIQGRVLEVGAGIGVNVFFLNKPEVTEWIAVEPDDKLTPECRSMLKVMGGRAKVFEGYLHDLDEKPGSFDCVILTTLLCSVPDPAGIVRDAHKMLKKGGKLYLIEHMGDDLGLRAAFQITAKLPWKWTTEQYDGWM